MPAFFISPRAESTTSSSIYIPGNSPLPTPPPVASPPPPSNAVVKGAIAGSILGFVLLLLLIFGFIRTSRSTWAPPPRSDRSYSPPPIYVTNPNIVPLVSRAPEAEKSTGKVPPGTTKLEVTKGGELRLSRTKRPRLRHEPVINVIRDEGGQGDGSDHSG